MKSIDAKHFLLEVMLDHGSVESYNEFPYCLQAVKNLNALEMHLGVTFIVGENGTGKSTLLEAIAIAWGFNAEGGSKNFNFASRASHSDLHKNIKFKKGLNLAKDGYFLRAESFYNVATNIEDLDRIADDAGGFGTPIIRSFGGESLHEQSHGESFFTLLMERFRGKGLYILDEPEAALSPQRQMAFISRLHQLVQEGAQFIIATHSPIIMAYPNALMYQIDNKGISITEYTQTEHFKVAKRFLNNYESMLNVLMDLE